MSPDELQQAWQSQSDRTRISIDSALLKQEVQRNQQDFYATIYWRDISEVTVSLVMLPLWFIMGNVLSLPWTWYLTVPALLWLIGFFLVDRLRHKQSPGEPGEPLLKTVQDSLRQVEHQIWLLRNVLWWYLMPFIFSILAFFTQTSWDIADGNLLMTIGVAAPFFVFLFVLYGFVYYINQRAVAKQLIPRRNELAALLGSLQDEGAGSLAGDFPTLLAPSKAGSMSRRRRIISLLILFVVLIVTACAIYQFARSKGEYPKLAPFTDVRWEQDTPVVQINQEWLALISVDHVPVKDILEFCRKQYGAKWQKRFAEDLIQVLSEMGHAPDDTVWLEVVSDDDPSQRRHMEVPMTAANRLTVRTKADWRAEREAREHQPDAKPTLCEDHVNAPLPEALEAIRVSHELPALAAFALRGDEIVEQATVGFQKADGDAPAAADAQWHLGSNTKAMTATIAGMLVEEGKLRWDSTLGEVLGERIPGMDAAHRDTTLAMLLHHTSGLTANINWFAAPEDRVACVAEILAEPPEGERGVYAYSNAGYVVAGALLEVVTGKRWEALMQERIFNPLGMAHSGFGAPVAADSPWGHESGLRRWRPKDPGARNADNAPVLGPAGTVHATLEDYAKFLAQHLNGAQGKDGLVKAATFATLHTPAPGTDYGMGWIITERDWAGGRALTHAGSNTLWFATAWIAPEKNMAFFAATNAGSDSAFKAVDKAVYTLIQRHLEEQ